MPDALTNGLSIVELEDSPRSTPCDRLALSFSSVATSLGPEHSTPRGIRRVHKPFPTFLDNEEEAVEVDAGRGEDGRASPVGTDSEDEEKASIFDDAVAVARAEELRRHRLAHGPSRADYAYDRQRLEAMRQNQLNNFVLRQSKATLTSRQDHHIMLRILIGEAYNRDPHRREHRQEWRRIVAAVRKEYWGANAIFTLAPDPYHNVLAKLSSMMVWDDEVRHWRYAYNDCELTRRRECQTEVLEQLQRSGKLFL